MSTQGPLAIFFSQYGGFRYNSKKSPTSEFNRLCKYSGWLPKSEAQESAYSDFSDALTKEFNEKFGTDAEDLAAWQNLCTRLHIQPIPSSLELCRKAVTNTHVNLVDLVYDSTDQVVTIFKTLEELSKYTKDTRKYFPKDNIHAGSLLKHLRRQILNPHQSRAGGPSGRRRRRGGA